MPLSSPNQLARGPSIDRRSSVTAVVGMLLVLIVSAVGRASERPDIVILYTDDQRHDSLSCTGNPYVRTPHLDRLAQEGVRFEQSLVAVSVCCPGRMSFLTGQYPHQHGVVWNFPEPETVAGNELFVEHFQRAGYETAFLGKWHLSSTETPARGFDHWLSFNGQGEYRHRYYHENGQPRTTDAAFSADFLTDEAIAWIQRPREQPYLLILSLKNCHTPWEPAERHLGTLDVTGVEPPRWQGELARPTSSWSTPDKKSERVADPDLLAVDYQRYLELVLSVDDNLGRLLQVLEESGRLDTTLVVMTSDNGFLFGEHGSLGKSQVYDPSLRVPLLARLPGEIPAGHVVARPVLNVDVAPTLMDLCAIPVPDTMHGRSFRELWQGQDVADWRETTLHYSPIQPTQDPVPPQIAVRAWPYKYSVLKASGGPVEVLVNLVDDPGEFRDLAGDPAHREEVERLRAELRRLMKEHGVPDDWDRNLRRIERRERRAGKDETDGESGSRER